MGSMWGRCGVDIGSMWGRCRMFSLLLLHLLISIVFPRIGQNQTITFEFGLIGLILAFWPFRGKTIEMRRWWRRRENKNEEEEEEEKQ